MDDVQKNITMALAFTIACGTPLWLIFRHSISFWTKRKFIAHRILGCLFLAQVLSLVLSLTLSLTLSLALVLQYAAAWGVFLYSYDLYLQLWFPFTLSANLLVQVRIRLLNASD